MGTTEKTEEKEKPAKVNINAKPDWCAIEARVRKDINRSRHQRHGYAWAQARARKSNAQ